MKNIKITYAKLRDGSWGIRSAGPLNPLQGPIEVLKKSGEKKRENLERRIWVGSDGAELWSISRSPSRPAMSSASRDDHRGCLWPSEDCPTCGREAL